MKNIIRLDFEGLCPVLVIGLMLIAFSVTDFLHGNGFLEVFDGLAWLFQIVLFYHWDCLFFRRKLYQFWALECSFRVF
jgi:potassium/hydrogen antiporter